MKRTLPLRLAVTFLLAAIPAARAHAQGEATSPAASTSSP